MSLALVECDVRELLARAYRRRPEVIGDPPGEERLVLGSISWEEYLAIDEERGADWAVPRLYYLERELEIATLSPKHECTKMWLRHLLVEFLSHYDVEAEPRGQATLWRMGEASAEPDDSWCFSEDKDVPDLV